MVCFYTIIHLIQVSRAVDHFPSTTQVFDGPPCCGTRPDHTFISGPLGFLNCADSERQFSVKNKTTKITFLWVFLTNLPSSDGRSSSALVFFGPPCDVMCKHQDKLINIKYSSFVKYSDCQALKIFWDVG